MGGQIADTICIIAAGKFSCRFPDSYAVTYDDDGIERVHGMANSDCLIGPLGHIAENYIPLPLCHELLELYHNKYIFY